MCCTGIRISRSIPLDTASSYLNEALIAFKRIHYSTEEQKEGSFISGNELEISNVSWHNTVILQALKYYYRENETNEHLWNKYPINELPKRIEDRDILIVDGIVASWWRHSMRYHT